jgi:hypothetical protein
VLKNVETHGLDFKKWDAVQHDPGGGPSVA